MISTNFYKNFYGFFHLIQGSPWSCLRDFSRNVSSFLFRDYSSIIFKTLQVIYQVVFHGLFKRFLKGFYQEILQKLFQIPPIISIQIVPEVLLQVWRDFPGKPQSVLCRVSFGNISHNHSINKPRDFINTSSRAQFWRNTSGGILFWSILPDFLSIIISNLSLEIFLQAFLQN